MLPVETPFKVYTGRDGKPLNNGYVYFGQPNQNPVNESQRVTVYWDAAGTQPADQPLRTENGYIMRQGTPANVFFDGAYSELVQDSKKRQVFYARTSDDFSIATVVLNFLASIAAAGGSILVGFMQAGANAILRNLQAKSRERVSVEDFYDVAMGADWTVAVQRAVASLGSGGVVEFNTPTVEYQITAPIVSSDATPIIFRGKGSSTVIKKMFNGDMFNLGKRSELRDIKLDGNGATYTGRGVIITTGGVDLTSWRKIDKVEMVNMSGYPVEFTAAISGYGTVISNCYLGAVAGGTAGVKMPAAEANGNRQMINVFTSGPMFDAAGCNNHYAQGCEGGAPTLTASSVKVRMNGCRIPFSPSTPTFVVDGVDTLVSDCQIGTTGLTFNSTLNTLNWFGNDDVGAAPVVIDNANGTNRMQTTRKLYAPTWAATAGAPSIGNGSLGAAYIRRGEFCRVTGTLSIGSTTSTVGTTWTMSVPYVASRNEIGSIFIQQTGTGLKQYAGSCAIFSGTSSIQFFPSVGTTALGVASPAAWVTGDVLIWNIEYAIQ